MKIQKKQLEKVVRKIVLESLEQSDMLRVLGNKGMHAVKQWVRSGSTDMYDLPQEVMYGLLDYFRGDMPVDVQKARSGDPGVWLADRLEQMMGHDPMANEGGLGGSDLGKRQTNLPQSTAGAVPRPQKKKNPALNRTVMDMPRKNEELDLDTGAIIEDAMDETSLGKSAWARRLDQYYSEITKDLDEYYHGSVEFHYLATHETDPRVMDIQDVKRMVNALAKRIKEEYDTSAEFDVKNIVPEKDEKGFMKTVPKIIFKATVDEGEHEYSDDDTHGLFS